MGENQKILAKQIESQALAIAWMAKTLHELFQERAQIMSSPAYAALMSSEFIGQRDFEIMDELGDILNKMDAAQDVPVFVDQAFEHGREMFGAKAKELNHVHV